MRHLSWSLRISSHKNPCKVQPLLSPCPTGGWICGTSLSISPHSPRPISLHYFSPAHLPPPKALFCFLVLFTVCGPHSAPRMYISRVPRKEEPSPEKVLLEYLLREGKNELAHLQELNGGGGRSIPAPPVYLQPSPLLPRMFLIDATRVFRFLPLCRASAVTTT